MAHVPYYEKSNIGIDYGIFLFESVLPEQWLQDYFSK
jgi:hypothetical protein